MSTQTNNPNTTNQAAANAQRLATPKQNKWWHLVALALFAMALGLMAQFALKTNQPTHPLSTHQASTPSGAPLPLAPFTQQITVINFWATWCPPCIEEMPELNAIYPKLKARNIELLGIAIDNPSAVQEFLKTTSVNYPIALLPQAQELSSNLGNHQGGLPYTVVLDANGKKIGEKLGKISTEELEQLLPN